MAVKTWPLPPIPGIRGLQRFGYSIDPEDILGHRRVASAPTADTVAPPERRERRDGEHDNDDVDDGDEQ